MEKTNQPVNQFISNKGFSYLELLLTLWICMNLFVITAQIFYNIDRYVDEKMDQRTLEFEAMAARIQHGIKQSDTPPSIQTSSISYTIKGTSYSYFFSYQRLGLTIKMTNSTQTTTYYLYDLKSITFTKSDGFLTIQFVTLSGDVYETTFIYLKG